MQHVDKGATSNVQKGDGQLPSHSEEVLHCWEELCGYVLLMHSIHRHHSMGKRGSHQAHRCWLQVVLDSRSACIPHTRHHFHPHYFALDFAPSLVLAESVPKLVLKN
jgi:hypothetical protein